MEALTATRYTMAPALTLARYTLLEARRGGLPWLALACVVAALGLAAFLAQVAIAESLQLQAALVAATLRASAVFLVATHVVTSVVRDSADKGLELVLSLPVSRVTLHAGKLAGFAAAGAAVATAFALPLLVWAAPGAVLAWWVSLVLETALVATLSLFFVFTLTNVVPALSAVAGIYLLSRSISALQAIASGPAADDGILGYLARLGMDGVGFLLPRLDTVTRTDWIVYGPPPAVELATVAGGLVLYSALVWAAGLVDFHRRNL
jgi:hypothetical protein